jgi:hypothetical protein
MSTSVRRAGIASRTWPFTVTRIGCSFVVVVTKEVASYLLPYRL